MGPIPLWAILIAQEGSGFGRPGPAARIYGDAEVRLAMAQAQDPTRVRSPVWIDAPTRISVAGPGRRRPGRVPRPLRRWPSAILDPAAPGLPCGGQVGTRERSPPAVEPRN